jgi:hypothetical protein
MHPARLIAITDIEETHYSDSLGEALFRDRRRTTSCDYDDLGRLDWVEKPDGFNGAIEYYEDTNMVARLSESMRFEYDCDHDGRTLGLVMHCKIST